MYWPNVLFFDVDVKACCSKSYKLFFDWFILFVNEFSRMFAPIRVHLGNLLDYLRRKTGITNRCFNIFPWRWQICTEGLSARVSQQSKFPEHSKHIEVKSCNVERLNLDYVYVYWNNLNLSDNIYERDTSFILVTWTNQIISSCGKVYKYGLKDSKTRIYVVGC